MLYISSEGFTQVIVLSGQIDDSIIFIVLFVYCFYMSITFFVQGMLIQIVIYTKD